MTYSNIQIDKKFTKQFNIKPMTGFRKWLKHECNRKIRRVKKNRNATYKIFRMGILNFPFPASYIVTLKRRTDQPISISPSANQPSNNSYKWRDL